MNGKKSLGFVCCSVTGLAETEATEIVSSRRILVDRMMKGETASLFSRSIWYCDIQGMIVQNYWTLKIKVVMSRARERSFRRKLCSLSFI